MRNIQALTDRQKYFFLGFVGMLLILGAVLVKMFLLGGS